jgi:hypothetical protein
VNYAVRLLPIVCLARIVLMTMETYYCLSMGANIGIWAHRPMESGPDLVGELAGSLYPYEMAERIAERKANRTACTSTGKES